MPSVDDLWEGLSRRAREAERARGVKRWVARWRTADGKTRKKRFHTRDEALTHALSHEGEGHGTDAAPAPPTVADAVAEYVHSKRHLSPRGLENVQLHASHVTKALGTITLADLTREQVEDWLASLVDVAPSSRAKRLTALRKALALAGLPDVTDGLAVRQQRTIQDFLTIDELVRVAKAARLPAPSKHGPKQERQHADLWETLILLMGTSGPRVSEAIAINVGHIDAGALTLFIPGTKTERSRRKIPIGGSIANRLAKLAEGRHAQEPLFATSKGTRLSRERIGERVREASERALGRRVRAHDLRHTAAALLIEAGGLVAASEILGHANPGITASIYGHVSPAQLRRITGRVDSDLTGLLGIKPVRPVWVGPEAQPDQPF